MKETKFIEQNKKKWKDFESLFESKQKDSKELSKLFIQITDDLSYSRTFYANRSVRVYLNNLAQNVYHKIFSRNLKKQNAVTDFITEELPSVLYYHRKDLLISFLITMSAVAIGLFTYWHDPNFASKILGDDYLSMTAENIANKNPMAVYKNKDKLEMFLRIVGNNLYVDCLTFFSGLLFMVGSVVVLVRNGLMLAAFQFYFVKKHLFWQSFLAVWLHGTLEISAMVICGAAGIILGKGLVFPGTFSRSQSFLSSAQRASKIFFAVLPITFTAGIIESFMTRYTEVPNALRLGLILASLFFILGYFVYLPWIKKRNGTLRAPKEEKVLPENFKPIDFLHIRKLSEQFLDTFMLFRKYFGTCFKISFLSAIGFTLFNLLFNKSYLDTSIINTNFLSFNIFTLIYGCVRNIDIFIRMDGTNNFAFVFPMLVYIHFLASAYLFQTERSAFNNEKKISFANWTSQHVKAILFSFIACYIYFLIFSVLPSKMIFACILLPVFYVSLYSIFFVFNNITQRHFSLKALSVNKFEVLIGMVAINTIVILIVALFNTGCYWFIYEGIILNFNNNIISEDTIYVAFHSFAFCLSIGISLYLITFFIGVFYFSQKEKITAEGLSNKLDAIGNKFRRYTFDK
jgi:uncharacterized membrane protein SpoIIM required for sporulation